MKKLLPLLIITAAIAIAGLLIIFKPKAKEAAPERPVASVELIEVQPESVRLSVHSQGTVLPRTETDLSVEVSGRVIEVSDNFRAGGFFEKDEVLLRIDPADYEAAVAARAAELADARLALEQEKALAEQAVADWAALGKGEPSDLTLRKPQLAQAEARIASAEAALGKARRDLARTNVKAPYQGRVLSKSVDLGQYVTATPATPVGRIYATDLAEIRLPVTEREASFLTPPSEVHSKVHLFRAGSSNDGAEWTGELARMEATIDPSSRLLYAVAVVRDPFRETPDSDKPALRRGLFVEAEIEGRTIEQAFRLPRYALRGSDSVYILTPQGTLQTRTVEIVKSDATHVIIQSGLHAGERVVISPVAYFVESMPAKAIEAQ